MPVSLDYVSTFCVICGVAVEQYDGRQVIDAWTGRFRAAGSIDGHSWVSSTGLFHGDEWISNNNSGVALKVRDMQTAFKASIPAMESDELRCFVFHDACWSLLQHVRGQEGGVGVSSDRLMQICHSLPHSGIHCGLIWGHGYQGLINLDDYETRFPWEDSSDSWTWRRSPIQSATKMDPFDIPEAHALIRVSGVNSTSTYPNASDGNPPLLADVSKDTFAGLPFEICEIIASFLALKDVRSLRHASKTFSPLFTSQNFWSSRFRPGAERGYLVEAQIPNIKVNWKLLFHKTKSLHFSPRLRNRKRVVRLCEQLGRVLDLHRLDSSDELNEAQSSLTYQVTARVAHNEGRVGVSEFFESGCKEFFTQRISLSAHLIAFAVSTIDFDDCTYVTGLRLVSQAPSIVGIGYQASEFEILVDVTDFEGFELAVGHMGINALQILMTDGRTSGWIGRPGDMPRTRCLAKSCCVRALEASFDGFKMVSLAVIHNEPSEHTAVIKDEEALRDTALWYPSYPPRSATLNFEHSTSSVLASTTTYLPIFWTSFGGVSGQDLQSLTGLTLNMMNYLQSIEFHYKDDSVRTFGRREPGDEYSRQRSQRFNIDGPGGELIEKIEYRLEEYEDSWSTEVDRRSVLAALRITTNRGNVFSFEIEDGDDLSEYKTIEVQKGTVITGFYGQQEYAERVYAKKILGLGVMSEVLTG